MYRTQTGTIDGYQGDVGTTVGISLIGDGDSTSLHSAGWIITNSHLGETQAWAVWLDGMQDVLIHGNTFDWVKGYGVTFYSPVLKQSSYRVNITGNNFFGVKDSSGSQVHIDLHQPCYDCIIASNVFSFSGLGDIVFQSAAAGSTVMIRGNDVFSSALTTGYVVSAASISNLTPDVEGNSFRAPGSYAGFFSNTSVKLVNNRCVNPFSLRGPLSGSDYQRGCFHFTGGSGSASIAVNNSATSSGGTKYPVLSVDSSQSSVTMDSRSNRSDCVTCAVCIKTASNGADKTFDEVVSNAGTSGMAAWQPTSIVGFTLIPVPYAKLGTPLDGTVYFCPDCTIAKPCAGGGSGALAKRLSSTWVCN
jgi:hypothetical protein